MTDDPSGPAARDPAPHDAHVWRAIVCVIAIVTVFSVTQGITYPLLSLILERQDTSNFLVGLSGAMTPLGVLASAPFLPALARRVNRGALLAGCVLACAALLLAIALVPDVLVWMPLRFLLGCAINGLYVIGETSLLHVAPRRHRGRVMGAYTAITNLGYAAGPALLAVTGSQGGLPFALGIAMLLAALLPLVLARASVHRIEAGREESGSIFRFMPAAPVLLVAYAATTLFDTALMTLFPIYGLAAGLSEAKASSVLTAILVGGVALQYPIGWLADRVSRAGMIVACTALALAATAAVPGALAVPHAIWALAVVWGGAVLGVQTLLLTELAARFTGAMLNAGNAAFGFTWGVSAIVGVPLAGAAMDALGPNGLLVTVAAPFALALLLLPFDRR